MNRHPMVLLRSTLLARPGGVAKCAAFVIACALGSGLAPRAVADLLGVTSTCQNTAVTEGQIGIVTCTATLNWPHDAVVNGEFAFAYPIGGDASDGIDSVAVFGPNPASGNPVDFQVLFTTPNDGPEPNPDFGVYDVSLILDVEDATDPTIFVPGTFASAAVAVYDVGLQPVVPIDVTPPPPTIPINSRGDYWSQVYDAQSRGYVTSIPEPGALTQFGLGLTVLAGLGLRQRTRLRW